MRAEWQRTHGATEQALTYFRVEHRGGRWTAKHIGVPVDSCRGKAASGIGAEFLKKWALQDSFTCSFAKYGKVQAQVLCLEWCHKMAFFCNIWLQNHDEGEFRFEEHHHRGYHEMEELTCSAEEWLPTSPAAQRLDFLRNLGPLGPAVA